ncbi:MAG: DUF3891 family protein [Candidatus Binatia bacterium]|jgi:hypothetical protein
MVIRELKNGCCFVSTQEDHAELSAQLAAHWDNEKFSRLRPYDTMVFATTYHDSGYREWEGNPPIHLAKGRPYAHRETIPSFEPVELQGARTVRFAPYPFDVVPLTVGVRARLLTAGQFASDAEALAAYHKAPRQLLSFEIVE